MRRHASFAETLSDAERKRYRFYATSSACWGSIPTVMLSDSAIIIVFASMLGMSDSFSMMTTAMSYLAYTFLMIPAAYVAEKISYQKTICLSVAVSMVMFLLLAAAPFFPEEMRGGIVLFACAGYSLTLPFYLAGWFPMLDTILLGKERGRYFSMMRLSWQFVAMSYIFLSGLLIGDNPPIWLLQIIIAVSVITSAGRIYYVSKIPRPPAEFITRKPHFRIAIGISMRNSSLGGFSVYLFCLFALCAAMSPITYIYLRHLGVPDDSVVIISSVGMIGTMAGYGFGSSIVKKAGTRSALIIYHFTYVLLNLMLFFFAGNSIFQVAVMGICLTVYGFTAGALSILISTEMMALARPGNKAMAMAFCGTFQYAGTGIARLVSSIAIGSGVLAESWNLWGKDVSKFQSLYLISAIGILLISLFLVIVPAVMPKHDDYYRPVA